MKLASLKDAQPAVCPGRKRCSITAAWLSWFVYAANDSYCFNISIPKTFCKVKELLRLNETLDLSCMRVFKPVKSIEAEK